MMEGTWLCGGDQSFDSIGTRDQRFVVPWDAELKESLPAQKVGVFTDFIIGGDCYEACYIFDVYGRRGITFN